MRRPDIYSPESSDGTFDWPSKIGIAVYILIGAVGLLLILAGCDVWAANCMTVMQGGHRPWICTL